MKYPQLIWAALLLLVMQGTVAQAQTKLPPRRPGGAVPARVKLAATGEGVKDGLTMQKGRIILTEFGVTNPLTADKQLLNGTTISTTGLVTSKDGTTTQINEGDHVSLSGRVTSRREMVVADSLAKIKSFDALHPGKRKKMEEEREKKEKAKLKREEEKIKAKEKAAKRKK
ncbi:MULTISPECIES: DUF6799 domain-containing protein [Hymenobacter]|uniref:DUF6799 domain-containing protein n=1 Tax=Hymenobacter armeniacus TaxID=2771358 RepID=A0ABR8JYT9_9BACT|nr:MULTISPECIES: DUF6799 domain-containing protein [Hymenobacter]MBD2723767.1 hypothetical protein [Hymenobacter armeniacus]MBJ6107840.1 hypothetical protein [Hymenobacter sp. BT523]